MFLKIYENRDILNDLQKIHLLFHKFQNPILTQVSYDLDLSNTVTYDFIANILASEATSLVDQNPRGIGDVNNRDNKSP